MILLAVFIIFAIIMTSITIYIHQRRQRIFRVGRPRARFFQHAMVLINDDITPPAVIRVLIYLSENIDNRTLARKLLVDAVRGELRRNILYPDRYVQGILGDVACMSPDQRNNLDVCASSFILALAHFDPLFGSLLKRCIFLSVEVHSEHVIRAIGARMTRRSMIRNQTIGQKAKIRSAA